MFQFDVTLGTAAGSTWRSLIRSLLGARWTAHPT